MAIYGYWVHSGAPDEHQRTPPQGMSTATTRATRRAPGDEIHTVEHCNEIHPHEGGHTRKDTDKRRTESDF